MDIMVKGNAKKMCSPDEVRVNINFYTKAQSYEEALINGSKDVESFIINVLEKLNFKDTDLKTNNFRIYEETRYDYETKKEIKLGFAYSQDAAIKFDYSNQKMADFIELISKLNNPPKCNLTFGLKNEEEIKNEILAQAYIKAKEKAEVIAKAANKMLKDCIKTDFQPFDNSRLSNSYIDTAKFTSLETSQFLRQDKNASEIIQSHFTPEDIELEENIYCLWLAE